MAADHSLSKHTIDLVGFSRTPPCELLRCPLSERPDCARTYSVGKMNTRQSKAKSATKAHQPSLPRKAIPVTLLSGFLVCNPPSLYTLRIGLSDLIR